MSRRVRVPCLALAIAGALLAACSTAPSPGPGGWKNVYTRQQDSAPAGTPGEPSLTIPDAVPRDEPRAKYGNKSPYTVLGRTYRVLADAKGYREDGNASWYDSKFHGFRTSSQETYDMHAMTAAHRTLPIPTWVRVTNLDNGHSAIVKVNDRGPFHRDRIIDLSWAAARKLGYAEKGTARVRVETVEAIPMTTRVATREQTASAEAMRNVEPPSAPPSAPPSVPPSPPVPPTAAIAPATGTAALYVQLGAFRARASAEQLAAQTRLAVDETVSVNAGEDGLFRVRVGPCDDRPGAERLQNLLTFAGLGTPVLIAAASTPTPAQQPVPAPVPVPTPALAPADATTGASTPPPAVPASLTTMPPTAMPAAAE